MESSKYFDGLLAMQQPYRNGLLGLGPITVNRNILAQGEAARQLPRNMLTGPTTAAEFAQNVGMIPGLDAVGIAGDLAQYYQRPETRTALNLGLTGLAALPFLGAMARMAGPMPKGLLNRQVGAIMNNIDEPPIKNGFVRLYRGQKNKPYPPSVDTKDAGRWFSTNKDVANFYGDVKYVDVPESIAKKLAEDQAEAIRLGAGGMYSETGRILPAELANKARPLK